MKKTYINPETKLYVVQTAQMMALSMNTNKADGSAALTKGDFWDDVWDDEE